MNSGVLNGNSSNSIIFTGSNVDVGEGFNLTAPNVLLLAKYKRTAQTILNNKGEKTEIFTQTPTPNKFNSEGYGRINCDLMLSEGTKFNIATNFEIKSREVKWFSAQEIWELKNPGKNYQDFKLTHHRNEGNIGGNLIVETEGNQEYKGVKLDVGGGITLISVNGQIFFKVEKDLDTSSSQRIRKNLLFVKHTSKGHIDEHSKMCEIIAKGGMVVHAKDGVILEVASDQLGKSEATAWVEKFRNDPKFMWEKITEKHQQWDFKKQTLTPGAAAVLTLAVGIVTQGQGALLLGLAKTSVMGMMASAALTKITTQASLSLINNKGDIGKVMQELGSSRFLRSLANCVAVAGITAGISQELGLPTNAKTIDEHLKLNLVKTGIGETLNCTIEGGKFNIEHALRNVTANTIGSSLCNKIGNIYKEGEVNPFTHKMLHFMLGAGTGAVLNKDALEGAAGGGMGALVATVMMDFFETNSRHKIAQSLKELEGKETISLEEAKHLEQDIDTYMEDMEVVGKIAKLGSGLFALSVGLDPETAIQTGTTAIDNNCWQLILGVARGAFQAIAKRAPAMWRTWRSANKIKDVIKETGENPEPIVPRPSEDVLNGVLWKNPQKC